MTTTARVSGLKQLGQSLKNLNGDVAGKVIFKAALSGAKVIQARASALASVSDAPHRVGKGGPLVQPGNLARGIATKRLKGAAGKAQYEVRWKAKRKGDPFYGLFVEFGTVNQPGKPFMRPAFDQSKDQALSAVQSNLGKGIAAAAKRAAKRVNGAR